MAGTYYQLLFTVAQAQAQASPPFMAKQFNYKSDLLISPGTPPVQICVISHVINHDRKVTAQAIASTVEQTAHSGQIRAWPLNGNSYEYGIASSTPLMRDESFDVPMTAFGPANIQNAIIAVLQS